MNTSLALVAAKALPSLSGSTITYNAEKNLLLTLGYTSMAGNIYYQAIRLSKRLAIYYDIGQAHYGLTFLNGITLYCWDGPKAKIIAKKSWGGANKSCLFNETIAKALSIIMLKQYLIGQVKTMGKSVPEDQILYLAQEMVEETHCKQIA